MCVFIYEFYGELCSVYRRLSDNILLICSVNVKKSFNTKFKINEVSSKFG